MEDTEVCLITKDDKSTVKSKLEEKEIKGVTKVILLMLCYEYAYVNHYGLPQVIPIAKLKTNYKSYELKRRLSSSYDVFLTDKRLYHMLSRLLGKKFFEKKKCLFLCWVF